MVASIRKTIYKLVDEKNLNSRSKLFNGFIIVLIILNIFSIILESYENLYASYSKLFYYFEFFSVVIFTIEYLLRLISAKYKYGVNNEVYAIKKYVFSFPALIDLFAILPFYIPFLINIDLRFIRILRIFRVSRILKIGRYSNSLKIISEVIQEKKSELIITIFITSIILVFSAILMFNIEHDKQPENFPNITAALWWAVATLTTVGYGDIYPITTVGKILSSIIAILGIGIIALPTGILSAAFIDKMKKSKTSEITYSRIKVKIFTPNSCQIKQKTK